MCMRKVCLQLVSSISTVFSPGPFSRVSPISSTLSFLWCIIPNVWCGHNLRPNHAHPLCLSGEIPDLSLPLNISVSLSSYNMWTVSTHDIPWSLTVIAATPDGASLVTLTKLACMWQRLDHLYSCCENIWHTLTLFSLKFCRVEYPKASSPT